MSVVNRYRSTILSGRKQVSDAGHKVSVTMSFAAQVLMGFR
jgi:hypothetical protein